MSHEEISINKTNFSQDESNQNNNHLGDKLNRHFSPLLFIGVFGGFLIYITFSILFIKKAQKNKTIKSTLSNLYLQQAEQIIFEVEQVLLYRTQSCFELLRKIESNAEFFYSLYGNVKVDKINQYIKDYSVNLDDINEYTENDDKKGIWGRNEESNENITKELFIFTSLNPLLYSILKSTNNQEKFIENIFVIAHEKEIFYDFPLSNDTYFRKGNKRAFCFNEILGYEEGQKVEQIIRPDRYDYHCQEWFADSINLYKIIKSDYYISSPYFIEKSQRLIIVTLCLNSTKLNDINSEGKIEEGNYYLFCMNINYYMILDNLESLNHEISGYFFVTRVFTQIAFYYPKRERKQRNNQTNSYYFDNFDNEEFQLNDNYYLDELNKYLNSTNTFISSYNSSSVNSLLDIQDEKLKGEFIKDEQKYYYYILPIFNHLSNNSINLMNIIYICPDKIAENKLKLIMEETINISTLSFPFSLFLIQTLIVQILVNYLIYAIAFNIVLPMKNIKKIFERFSNDDPEGVDTTDNIFLKNMKISMMNNNLANDLFDNEDNEKRKDASRRNTSNSKKKGKINKVVNINNKSSIENNIDIFDDSRETDTFLSNYKESDSDTDNEEDYLNIKSKDIQDLFCKMINVKNSLDIVNSDEQNDVRKLSDMLFASEIFKEIKNDTAKNICLSNIGNILLKLKKYDIAILHLIQSDTFIDDEDKRDYGDNEYSYLKNNSERNKNKKKKRKRRKNLDRRKEEKNNNLNKEQLDQKLIEENKPLIESRYPKLIFCYKQFFKNLKKLKKIRHSQEIANKKIDEQEIFISREYHMLNNFKQYIEKFVNICQLEGSYLKSNTKYILALMEKIEFIIKYEITSENTYNNNMAEKMKTLNDLFSKVKKLIKGNKEILKPKNILKFLLKEEYTNELDEIPNSILMQRLNYYKGCLALKCCHYLEAVKKFQKIYIKSSNKITDGNIVVKGFKKLIKIAEIMKQKCNYLKKIEEEKILKSYISDRTKEIKKFISVDRDFVILISTNTQNTDFFTSSLENTRYIIDNYVKNNDRYCIAFSSSDTKCTGGLKILTKLRSKNDTNNDSILEFIQSIKQDLDLLSSYIEDEEDNMKYILQKAKSYYTNKNMNKERNTLIVFFGNKGRLSQASIDFLCSEELGNFIDEDNEKLLLVLQDNYEQNDNAQNDNENNVLIPVKEKDLDINKLNKKVCMYIHFDEIQKIKKEVMMYGKINSLDQYNFEKYESRDQANELI